MGDGQRALRVDCIRAHGNGNGGNAGGDISIYGQESNYITWRLAKMNLAIRGIGGQIAVEPQEDDEEPFDDKMKRLVAELREQQAEGARIDAAITDNLEVLATPGSRPGD